MRLHKYVSSAGSAIMVVIFSTAMVLAFIVTTFARVSSQLSAVSRQSEVNRAFQMAEAGLDDRLTALNGVTADQIPGLIAQTPSTIPLGDGLSSFTYQYLDDGDPTIDGVILRVTGTFRNTTQQLEGGVRLGGSAMNPIFNYAAAGRTINMDGNAIIGDAFNAQAKLYTSGPATTSGLFATSGSNAVWAAQVDFYNPTNQPLAIICPNCSNPAIFHAPVTFNMAAPSVPVLSLDLRPYYNQAVAEGHVITSSQTYTNQSLSGVYYVECGVSVTFKGNCSLRGTLVHEGCNGDIKIASNGVLTIDSLSGTQFDKGSAILGAPGIQFGNTTSIDISGVVMHTSSASVFSPTGSINGSFIGINGSSFATKYPDLVAGPGPGSYAYLDFPLENVHIGGGANVIFHALSTKIKGDVTASGGKPQVLYWRRL